MQLRIRVFTEQDGVHRSVIEGRIDGKRCRVTCLADSAEGLKQKQATVIAELEAGTCPESDHPSG